MRSDIPLPAEGQWLWRPDAHIQWRIAEALLFYGTDSLLRGDNEAAARYFRQMVLVEPDNQSARENLALAEAHLTGE